MKRYIALLLCLLITALLVPAALSEAAEPTTLRFATMQEGTGAYSYAQALAEIMQKALPEGVTIELVTDSPGSVHAPELIDAGEYDLVMSNAAPALWYAEQHEDTAVRALIGGLGSDFVNVMMTDQFSQEQGVSSLEEIIERKLPVRLAVKEEGSLGEMAAQRVLAAMGVSYADIEAWGGKVIHTGSAGIAEAFIAGEADLTIDHISSWQGNTTQLCEAVHMVFPQLSEETLAKLRDAGFATVAIEKGMFDWQLESIATVGSQQVVLVNESMDPELAYTLAKAVCENADVLRQSFPALETFSPSDAGAKALNGAKAHPGAAQYYWENGYPYEIAD